METIKSKIYKTDSFHLASYIIAKGCELQGVEPYPDNDKKFIFCFFNTKMLRGLLDDYYSLQASVKPQDFANAQKTLKSIIYSNRNYNL